MPSYQTSDSVNWCIFNSETIRPSFCLIISKITQHLAFSWNNIMAAILNVLRHSRNPELCQSTHIYVKNNLSKFHPQPIWNDGAIDFFAERCPNKKRNKNSNMSSDMWSDPYLNISLLCHHHKWCFTTMRSMLGCHWDTSMTRRVFSWPWNVIKYIGSCSKRSANSSNRSRLFTRFTLPQITNPQSVNHH